MSRSTWMAIATAIALVWLAAPRAPLADPSLTPELALDEPLVDLSTHLPRAPSVAASDTGHLVVWSEPFGEADVRAARLDADGALLDPTGITIASVPGLFNAVESPRVVSNGTDYLVVWTQGELGGEMNVYAARLRASDGAVLDSPAIVVRELAGSSAGHTGVASDGTDYLVVWEDDRDAETDIDVYGARVLSADGSLAGAGPFPISLAPGETAEPDVASNGSAYLVVWSDLRSGSQRTTYGARVAADGTVMDGPVDSDPGGIAIGGGSDDQRLPAVASDGTDYLVVWEDDRGPATDIYGARVAADTGTVLDGPDGEGAGGLPISTASNDQTDVAVASDGTDYLVSWIDQRAGRAGNVVAARVLAADGTVPEGSGEGGGVIVSRGPAEMGRGLGVAAIGGDFLVAWEDVRRSEPSSGVIYGARLVSGDGGDLTVDPPVTEGDPGGFPISYAPNSEQNPAVASNGDVILVVWEDRRNIATTGLDILGVRVDVASGAVLDSPAIVISAATDHQSTPAVAASGDRFLVAWSDARSPSLGEFDIYGARVLAATGEVLDGNDDAGGIDICTQPDTQGSPAVASDGTDFLVAWSDARNRSRTNVDVYAARVSGADGTVFEPAGLRLSDDNAAEGAPAAAGGGGTYLVAWQDFRNGSGNGLDIYANLVDAEDGTVSHPPTDPMSDGGFPVSAPAGSQLAPAVGFDGGRFLVSWVDQRNTGASGSDIYATRVSTSGSNLDGYLVVQEAAGDQTQPRVAATAGSDFLVAWLEPSATIAGGVDLMAARVVGDTATVRDGPADDRGFLLRAAVVGGDVALAETRLAVAAYTRVVDGAYRIWGRSGDLNEAPVATPQTLGTDEDTPLPIQLAGQDDDGDPLAFTVVSGPDHGALSGPGPDGVVPGGALSYLPESDWSGQDAFDFIAADDWTDSGPATVTIDVTARNDPPVFVDPTPDGLVNAFEGSELSFRVVASDIDGPSLAVGVDSLPSGAVFEHDPGTEASGTVTWTPAYTDAGVVGVSLTASDGLAPITRPLTIAVTAIDDDSDGLPDTWEGLYGLDTSRNDAGEDPDGDGRSNLDELLLGTAPNVSNAPTTPLLIAPEDDARVDSARPRLVWTASTDPEGDDVTYAVWVAPVDDPDVPVFNEAGLEAVGDEVSAEPDLDLDEGAHKNMTASPTDGTLSSPHAQPRRILVDPGNLPPPTPTLVAPPDRSTVAELSPRLQVNRVVDPDDEPVTYRFEVGRSGSVGVVYDSGWLADPGEGAGPVSYALPDALPDGSSWWWVATAKDARGLTNESDVYYSFAVDRGNRPPPAPAILYPVDGATVRESPPTLRVEAVADPEGTEVVYRVALSPDDTFSPDRTLVFDDLLDDGDEVRLEVPVILPDGAWVWEVTASDGQAVSPPTRAGFVLETPADADAGDAVDAGGDVAEAGDVPPDAGADADAGEGPDAADAGVDAPVDVDEAERIDLLLDVSSAEPPGVEREARADEPEEEGCGCGSAPQGGPGWGLVMVLGLVVAGLRRHAGASPEASG